ncbi:NPCBM-associated, NEW3 domain of alpha-galactosidase [Amycolatopsis arida]|uniref:NPCBM-associated, NEW3 domain of alpha-galactosidase n=1 Tax=Amycolatopsis arida TaxID=587909 RepID=A0A1I5XDY9_9PSEU|nr:glycoside hydrolase family 97 catalytic domain-containing protein [Amycolatopsis arida]TDX97511.1 alpha-galactosidase-like protein [Amycolatopsis arida]SFQ30094.1 NPCBM-associated, NEW3 domain of alpha-galactosidase [Amycolatopsis arida]
MRSWSVAFLGVVLVVGLAPPPVWAGTGGWAVRSVSGTLAAEVHRDARAGTLRLAVRTRHGEVLSADLGVRTERADLTRDLRPEGARLAWVHERYETAVGKRRRHRDTARELSIAFRHPSGQRLEVEVRVFDDGVGYRYRLPGAGPVRVLAEASSFRFPAATTMWAAEHRANYENLYDRLDVRAVEDVPYQFPALFRVPGGAWALVSESDVDGRYAAAHLRPTGAAGHFRVAFPDGGVRSALPLATPWRVAVVGGLADIVRTDLVTDLAQDARFPIPDWVRPGRVAWSWWSEGSSPRDERRQRDYVDHAAEEGWEYVLVDEGWSPEWMPGFVDYAARRGVGVLLWARWTDLDTPAERDTLLARWKSWGVAGVKIDFMDSDSQDRMRWYDDVLAATAEHRLAVNFHGSTVPRGVERTWPHVLTMEGVRGAEDYHFGYLTPRHNVMLPFTRNVVGPMDYTPVTFSAQRETSAGHELALAVVYESGWQHPADGVESYDSRGVVEAVLRRLPTAWDETRLVDGMPGESATVARRAGRDWFVGAIRAGQPADLRIPLDFLEPGRRYVADIVRDTPGTGLDDLEVERRTVEAGTRLTVPAAEHGGAVVLLCPAERGGCLDDTLLSRLTVRPERGFLDPGSTATVEVAVENDTVDVTTVDGAAGRPLERVAVDLTVPPGWEVRPVAPVPATVPPGGTVTGRWIVAVPADAELGSAHELRAELGYRAGPSEVRRTAVEPVHVTPAEPPPASGYLSDGTPLRSFNWVGPVERDRSNGGPEPGDGGPITLGGRVYAKGLGGHAHSEQVYHLGGRCDRFRAVVGLDDVAGPRGSVVFQVWTDGRLRHDSGPRVPGAPPVPVDVPLRGAETLRLVLADGGDFVPDDLGDWADARVSC